MPIRLQSLLIAHLSSLVDHRHFALFPSKPPAVLLCTVGEELVNYSHLLHALDFCCLLLLIFLLSLGYCGTFSCRVVYSDLLSLSLVSLSLRLSFFCLSDSLCLSLSHSHALVSTHTLSLSLLSPCFLSSSGCIPCTLQRAYEVPVCFLLRCSGR